MTDAAAPASPTGVRGLAAGLERGELALIPNRQTAQKRHVGPFRRRQRPPVVDMQRPVDAVPAAGGATVTSDGPSKPWPSGSRAACMGLLTAAKDPSAVVTPDGTDPGGACNTLGFGPVP